MFTERASRVGAAITESTRTLHTQVRNHSRLCGGDPSSSSLSLAHALTQRARARRPADGGAAGCVLPAPQARAPLLTFTVPAPPGVFLPVYGSVKLVLRRVLESRSLFGVAIVATGAQHCLLRE
jgi:hypothetical protein